MIIKKWIQYEEEIDVEICAKDLKCLYLEDEEETELQLARLTARAHEVFYKIDPEIFSNEKRQIISDALLKLSNKFKPCDKEEFVSSDGKTRVVINPPNYGEKEE